MRTYDLTSDGGELVGFEVENTFLGRRGVVDVVRRIGGGVVLSEPGAFEVLGDAPFCRFRVGATSFVAIEPFGDNSRYWICPEEPGTAPDLLVVRDAFRAFRVPYLWRTTNALGIALLAFGLVAALCAPSGPVIGLRLAAAGAVLSAIARRLRPVGVRAW
jgi:hypothetical protein